MLPAVSLLMMAGLAAPCPVPADPGTAQWQCPQVHRVRGTSHPDASWNILFLPDGFQADEIEKYRCAVHRLMEGVLGSSLFSRFACRVNVYRIDLAASPGRTEIETHPDCTTSCPTARSDDYETWRCRAGEGAGTPIGPPERPACAAMDINARKCHPIPTRCDVLWPDTKGLMRAYALATCSPRTHAVVVIANTPDYSGAGLAGDNPGLAVVTLADMNLEARWSLLAHELGHALFSLLDEYDQGTSEKNHLCGRNVVSSKDIDRGDIPWKDLRTSREDYCHYPDCCKTDREAPEDYVGLVEGAFNESCGYYRSQATCRMRNVSSCFCAACGLFADGLAKKLRIEPCPAETLAGAPEPSADVDPP